MPRAISHPQGLQKQPVLSEMPRLCGYPLEGIADRGEGGLGGKGGGGEAEDRTVTELGLELILAYAQIGKLDGRAGDLGSARARADVRDL